MKIVVLDDCTENPGDLSWGGLEKLGEPAVYDRASVADGNEITSRIGDTEVVITNKASITKSIMGACPDVECIVAPATGYNVVDYIYVREKETPLSNVPFYGTASVDQFVIAILPELCHHVAHHSQTVHEGKWEHCQDWRYWNCPLVGLDSKTMDIIGFGRIEQQAKGIAKAMGMNILTYDNYPNEFEKEVAECVDLDILYVKSDIIALHCSLLPEAQGVINKDAIAKMKNGMMILSSSRDPLIVEQGLADTLNPGKVSGAGPDVVSTEPIKGDNPPLKAEGYIITPHISWAPKESRQRIMNYTVENVKAYLAGAPIHMVD